VSTKTSTAVMIMAVAGIALMSVVLAGCSSDAAEPVPASPSTDAQREASLRGTEICVQNNSTMNMRILWRGFPVKTEIPPAATTCNTGYETTKADVFASLEYQPPATPDTWLTLGVTGSNHWAAEPSAAVWFEVSDKKFGVCDTFDVGDTRSFRADAVRIDLSRIDDTQENKKFIVNLTDSEGAGDAPNQTNCIKEQDPEPL
jgi:hypothetical protein